MIILRAEIDNFFTFKNTILDLSINRTEKDSTIENEFLEHNNNFKFKRVCIIAGANASGKTNLGRMLCAIQHYVFGKKEALTSSSISNKSDTSSFQIDFVVPEDYEKEQKYTLHRLLAKFDEIGLYEETYSNIIIKKNESYKSVKKRLDSLLETNPIKSIKNFHCYKYIREREGESIKKPGFISAAFMKEDMSISETSWAYAFSENSDTYEIVTALEPNTDFLLKIMKTFDKDIDKIIEVVPDEKVKPLTFKIIFKNGDSVIVEGHEVSNPRRLSKGTYQSINLATFIMILDTWKKKDQGATIYIDEQLAYSHSEIEQSILTLLINKTNRKSQLFFTTHNYNILDLNLPHHSFLFMCKDEYTEIINAESKFNKNDRKLLNYVKNDVFETLPDTSPISDLMED